MARHGYGGAVYRDLRPELQVILRVFIVLVCLCGLWVPAQADTHANALERALAELRAYRWDSATQVAQADGRLAADIVEWHRLRAGHGTYDEVTEFLARNADWPGLELLRKASEKALIGQSARAVLAYFDEDAPQTATGAILLAQALQQSGDDDAAAALIQTAWLTMTMSDVEFQAFTTQFSDQIADAYVSRLDQMLWDNETVEVSRLLSRVPVGWQALAQARSALRRDAEGVDALIAAVPADLQTDPGLVFERFLWRMRKDRDDDAKDLLLQQSTSAQALDQPEYWANQRRNLARIMKWDGQYQAAYDVAANHFLPADHALLPDLEWVAGYTALTHLDDPERAEKHFQNLLEAVDGPISLARAGYWLGRAYAAMGNPRAAEVAYEGAALYSSTFYGLLAADALGQPVRFPNQAMPENAWRQASFTASSVFQAGLLTLSIDELYLAERFFVQLAEDLTHPEVIQLGNMLEQLGQPHLALRVAKHALNFGDFAFDAFFPLHPVSEYQLPVSPELVLAIARRESEFDPTVVSRAGAAGLLQLMPGTAADMAREAGATVQQQRLVTDWRYNAALGSAYLAELVNRFDGNIVLISAAYNAGPNRVDQWLGDFGDPRRADIDVVDWIEAIPFRETRNYVMRVSESLPAYRHRLGINPNPVPFSAELAGSTLRTLSP